MSQLVAVFAANDGEDSWSLRIAFDDPAFRFPGDSPLGPVRLPRRPDLEGLSARMREARSGCVIRRRPDGAIELSAVGRAAVVLYDWLVSLRAVAERRCG